MPETPAPKMVRIDFAVPAPLLEEVKALAELEGWKEAELHRILWERGLSIYVKGSNDRLTNRKLREELK